MSKRKSNKKRIWIIVAIVVVLGGLVTANILTNQTPDGEDVDVTIAELDSLVQTVTASGKIQPKIDVDISANVSGRILFLGGEEGDTVMAGQELVRIEDEEYAAQLENARFSVTSAEASLEEAQSQLKRVRQLHDSDLSSDAELENATATVKRLDAELDRAKSNLTQALDRFSKTRLSSPINGTITRLNKEVGEMAIGATFSQDVIMVVSRLDSMEVNVEVNENDVVLVAIGDRVEIEVFAMPDTLFHGEVSEIAHSGIVRGAGSAEEVTNFSVTVAIRDRVVELRPGMSATVDIITETRNNTLVLPQEAVAVRTLSEEQRHAEKARSSDKKSKDKDGEDARNSNHKKGSKEEPVEVVFVAESDTVWARQVKLGIYSDTHFEILSGIEEGDLIVTGPFRLLSRELHSGQIVSYDEPKRDEQDEQATETSEQ